MSILIGADIVPTHNNLDLFVAGDREALIGEKLCQFFDAAGHRIFNLEVPLTDHKTPIDKCGPNLIAPTETITGLKALNIDLLGLANNHIMDQAEQGLQSTIALLKKNEINYVGVGDVDTACKPYIFDFNGKKVGVYACAEHEFSIVSASCIGANPFNSFETPDQIAALKQQCDFVIVLYHGGKEHYRYPSPELQKIFRKMADKGADLVIAQHTHCIGCEEKYKNATLVYGQGNFLFDDSDIEEWQTSLLIQINDDFSVTYLPLVKNNNTVRLAEDEKADEIITQFRQRSDAIKESGFIDKQYHDYASKMLENYLSAFSGKRSFAFRTLNKITGHRLNKWILRRKYGKKELLAIRNFVECEAHRELVLIGINSWLRK